MSSKSTRWSRGLYLFGGIEQGQGERADDKPVLIAERDAVDEELPFAALNAPPRARSGSPEAMTAGMPESGMKSVIWRPRASSGRMRR